jgi:hypothetical protein
MAKAAAQSTLPPRWTLNTSLAPVHKYELLVSGLNTLLPARQVIKKQSRARHTEELWKHIVKHHQSLGERAPTSTKPANSIGGTWREPGSCASAEEYHSNAVRREFALKMAVGQLPTLARQHQWNVERYPSDRCPRCEGRESETWKHITRCAANRPDKEGEARRFVRGRLVAAVRKVNEARASADPPQRPRAVDDVARQAMPTRLVDDVGWLLGQPDESVVHTLKQLGFSQSERQKILMAITTAALEFVRKEIWIPRCKEIKDLLGTWATRLQRLQREPSAAIAPASGPRQRTLDDRPHVGFSGVTDSRESTSYWDGINKRVFNVEHYLKMVAPEWAY